MKKIVAAILIFVALSAGVAVIFIARINQTTSDAALATGSRAIVLPNIFDNCGVFLLEECNNTATRENVSFSYDTMSTILHTYPQSKLLTHYEPLASSMSETDFLPIKETASHLIVAIGRETGVSYKILLALMSAIGSDPIRKADADMLHPFGEYSTAVGFVAQTREIANEIAELQRHPVDQVTVGGRTYVIAKEASLASRTVYQFLAAHVTNPDQFERITLPQYKSQSDNFSYIWTNLIEPKSGK
jgi:hypothetical protein